MRPLIAITGQRDVKVSILRFSATLASEAMCEALFASGGEPVILHGPATDPGVDLARRLERFDGVLMPGGADLGPERYGQVRVPETTAVVPFQDDLDLAMAQAVVAVGLPTLAVCRGMQVLNVALGGTLHQHLAETSVGHRKGMHDVEVERDSRLRAILGRDTVPVSSYHHQAVDRVAKDLVVTARAADGVPEGVEHRSADVIGVQWHPEDLHATSPTDAALFGDLVERAQKRMAAR